MENGQLARAELSPLIRSHLRARDRVSGEPARDPQLGTADFPMLVAVDNIDRRFARHFDLSPDHAA